MSNVQLPCTQCPWRLANHVAVGAKLGATARECPGSVVVVLRELQRCAAYDGGMLSSGAIALYLRERPHGITRMGIIYWAVTRISLAGVPFIGGIALPTVNTDDPEVGLGALDARRT